MPVRTSPFDSNLCVHFPSVRNIIVISTWQKHLHCVGQFPLSLLFQVQDRAIAVPPKALALNSHTVLHSPTVLPSVALRTRLTTYLTPPWD